MCVCVYVCVCVHARVCLSVCDVYVSLLFYPRGQSQPLSYDTEVHSKFKALEGVKVARPVYAGTKSGFPLLRSTRVCYITPPEV